MEASPMQSSVVIVGSDAEDYDVTEKCLSWQESCVTGNYSAQPFTASLSGVEQHLDNCNFFQASQPVVDNVHCLSSSYHASQCACPHTEHVPDENYNMTSSVIQSHDPYITLFSIQEEQDHLDNASVSQFTTGTESNRSGDGMSRGSSRHHHCCNAGVARPVVVARTRRDSEESMDTTISQASGSHATRGFSSSMSDTASSFNSADCLAREEFGSDDEHPLQKVSENLEIPPYYDHNSSTPVAEITALSDKLLHTVPISDDTYNDHNNSLIETNFEIIISNADFDDQALKGDPKAPDSEDDVQPSRYSVLNPQPFSSFQEEVDPDFVTNPPRVTDKLIVIENEDSLINSQLSLCGNQQTGVSEEFVRSFADRCTMTRATTLPNLYVSDIKGCSDVCDAAIWGYSDARLFFSNDTLHQSTSSYFLEKNGYWTQTGHDVPRYNDFEDDKSFEKIGEGREHHQQIKVVPSSEHTGTLILLSLCMGALFTAMGAVKNLQSSMFLGDNLGVKSLALMFAGYTGGNLICHNIFRFFQPKTCLIASIIPNFLFLLSNLHPKPWILLPVAFLQGISVAFIWSVATIYVTLLGRGRALSKGESVQSVCSRFFSIIYLAYQSSLVLGNLAASALLLIGNSLYNLEASPAMPSKSPISLLQPVSVYPSTPHTSLDTVSADSNVKDTVPENAFKALITQALLSHSKDEEPLIDPVHSASPFISTPVCGSAFFTKDQNFMSFNGTGLLMNDDITFMLHGTFVGCVLVALGIAVFGIEPLDTSFLIPDHQCRQMGCSITVGSPLLIIKKNIQQVGQLGKDVKFLLLMPMLMYSIMQFAFMSADFTAAFISCPLGIHHVGFGMAAFIVGGFPTAFFCGQLTKMCGRLTLITIAATINLICLIIMAQWQPSSDDIYLIYTMLFSWGISDGIWMSQTNNLINANFKHALQASHIGMRVAQGFGATVLLSVSPFVDMHVKVFIMMASCTIALLGYLLMKLRLRAEKQWDEQKVYQICSNRVPEDV